MKAIVEINMDSKQARELLNFIETLPFVKVQRDKVETKNAWDKAVEEGAVSVDEFGNMFRDEIQKAYHL